MEGERKKRKMENEGGEEDEEEKMEKFFALIRSTREVRNRLMRTGANLIEKEEGKKVEKDKALLVWNPTFQPEDFIDEEDNDKSKSSNPGATTPAGPSNKKEEKDHEEEDKEGGGDDGLDLKLSL